MRRRQFIRLLGGTLGALTCDDVFAAPKSPVARVGYLSTNPLPTECCVTTECRSVRREACQNACAPCWLTSDLHALGWREGENLQIEIRSSNGVDLTSLPRLAAELVALTFSPLALLPLRMGAGVWSTNAPWKISTAIRPLRWLALPAYRSSTYAASARRRDGKAQTETSLRS
jgi:hypothetical protein